MSEVRSGPWNSDVTLAILAGGEGSRMAMPKALLKIEGQPILDYLLDRLSWPGQTMLVTAPGREHPPAWERFTCEVSDPQPGGGPLRGVLTALENLTTPLLLVLTVDMPGVGPAQCAELLNGFRSNVGWAYSPTIASHSEEKRWSTPTLRIGTNLPVGSAPRTIRPDEAVRNADPPRSERSSLGAMFRRQIDGQFQIEPFPCILRAEAQPTIARRLAENRRSVHGLLDEPRFVVIDAPAEWDSRVWVNLNEPSDL